MRKDEKCFSYGTFASQAELGNLAVLFLREKLLKGF